MFDFYNWSFVEYLISSIIALYLIKGVIKHTSKSVISLILFPLAIIFYFFIIKFSIPRFFAVNSFYDVIKVLILSFLVVIAVKYIMKLILFSLVKRENYSFFKEFFSRIPGCFASVCEGLLLISVIFWSIDYFDYPVRNNYPEFSKNILNNYLFEKVTIFNPVYDIKGSKNLKYVLTALSIKDVSEKIFRNKALKKFLKIEAIDEILNNKEFQKIIEQKNLSQLIFSASLRSFLKNEEVYKFLTSDEFVMICKNSLSYEHIRFIDDRKGLFAS